MAHNKNLRCLACNLEFETESRLSNHNYDTHVDSIQVTFDDELITVERSSDKFQCPKCEKQLKTPTTLKRHIGKHYESIGNAGKKQRLSEPEDINEEFPSISLDHQAPDAETIDLQADSSSSFPSTSHLEKDTATLIAMNALSLSKREQEKCLMLADLADLEPIIILAENGKKYHMLASPKTIQCVLTDQPTGTWKLPISNDREAQN
ncbi:uncharacterized protein EV154DRAFT_526795 [Mucor mucedo]|uniref:uncharacterized protein n=1 Tax=Mucor mucedo TaxID=29922 RepID=UPI002220BE30|nr:uncharacterized protein EV154DRAFT_526795 [Mucor mucedo]KAI7875069.1 hypothetical protein EV154DRAFT_526795 [Mucor mucedo]